jgi:phospholipid transport system substrate-binding protein
MRVPSPYVFALTLGLWLIDSQPVYATSPTAMLEAFFERANTVLQSVDPERGLEEPRQAIRDLVNEMFEFRGAGALVLGSVWLSRVPEDQDEFVRLFANVLERGFVAAISSKASTAGGVRIQYLGESVAGDSATVATTILTRTGHALPVDYWLVRRGERWKVQDVVIDGVSLLANYRAQFKRVLAVHPYTELIARMRGETSNTSGRVVATVPDSQAAPRVPEPRPELQLTVFPSAVLSSDRPRASAKVEESTVRKQGGAAKKSQPARTSYWVQVGAFQTVEAAVQLAERFRHDGATVSKSWLTNAAGKRVGVWARVRVGPFAHRSEAVSKLHDLRARGATAFIPERLD